MVFSWPFPCLPPGQSSERSETDSLGNRQPGKPPRRTETMSSNNFRIVIAWDYR